MSSPITAANAYASLARVLDTGGSGTPFANLAKLRDAAGAGSEAGGSSFSAVLKDAIGSVAEAGRKSDAQTVAMASGKANVMDVVTAVAETDVAVSTLVSVRDRVIQSYEDIMKMSI
jgi:flagellar hook-basal body complex protein FliE